MPTMRVMQVPKPNAPFQLIDRPIPDPPAGSVRIRVEACGICHSDVLTKSGAMPGIAYPRVPGHEVAGIIDAIGAGVMGWSEGTRVGVGWHGGYCGRCDACRRGNFFACILGRITGLTHDGGCADYMLADATAIARIPDGLSAVDAAPLVCAGVTTFNSLRNSGARPGETVAILGLGGLGHLGVQFAVNMGFRVVAIARGKDKEPLARKLGARHYIDSAASDPAAELVKLGGAKIVLATVTNGPAMTATLGGLQVNGSLIVLGAPHEPLEVNGLVLLGGRRSVMGWYSGTSIDSEDTLAFSQLTGVRPMTEVYPLEKAEEGFGRMMSGAARFRVVLKTGN